MELEVSALVEVHGRCLDHEYEQLEDGSGPQCLFVLEVAAAGRC